jgi:ribonuclease R
MINKILEILKKDDKAYTVHELNDLLGHTTVDEFKELLIVLNDMENSLQVYHTNKDKFMLFNNSNMRVGRLIGHRKGFGFVDIEGDVDVFVAPVNINGAIHNDKVVVEITNEKGIELEGRIVKILERNLGNMVGEFYFKNGMGYIDLDDEKVKINIQIDPTKAKGAMNGHKVLVKVANKLKDNNYIGEIVKVLGHRNDPGVDILSIVYKYGINTEFPDAVMKEVEKLPISVSEAEIVGRHDLRGEEIFTIDGDDTKDIDDAISLKMLDNGNYLLGVHIADVSYYVKENSALDIEAADRATSNYLADRVIPMLPHALSNGICSLNPNVDRLAITCDMEIDSKGDVVGYDIYPSVIKSRLQMTYKKVNRILDNVDIPEGYQPYKDTLLKMNELALILRKNKEQRGMIDFNIDESKIIVDEKGKAVDVKLRERGQGEKLIEDYMIVANETVASHIYYMELPFVYRVHGEPSEEKITNFLKFISLLGYKVDGKVHDVHPKTLQMILESLQDKKEFLILSRLLLRSMQKAIYDPRNIGHYGLASKCYTHFTSPIRRYPDSTVHRLLRTYLFESKIDEHTINYWDAKLLPLTAHSSLKEREAIECEREVDDMKKAEYMMEHIGEEFEGMITSVLSFGMFVELPNLIEGLIRLEDLCLETKDQYFFDQDTFSIRSPKNPRGYRMGDFVKVKVKNANKELKTIDFSLSNQKELDEEVTKRR